MKRTRRQVTPSPLWEHLVAGCRRASDQGLVVCGRQACQFTPPPPPPPDLCGEETRRKGRSGCFWRESAERDCCENADVGPSAAQPNCWRNGGSCWENAADVSTFFFSKHFRHLSFFVRLLSEMATIVVAGVFRVTRADRTPSFLCSTM